MSENVKTSIMEDPEDLELQEMMGKHFQDLSKAAPAPAAEKKTEAGKSPAEKKSQQKVMDAAWVPVKANPTKIQRLVDCAKHTVIYGGISGVLFWWQQAGLLAPEAAWPSFIVLALLAGLKIGSCIARG